MYVTFRQTYALSLTGTALISAAFFFTQLIVDFVCAFDIPANMVVLAYIFGDGFANYIYPTDAALLISLNLSDYTYVKYIKDTWIYHLLTFLCTCGILILGLAVGYC